MEVFKAASLEVRAENENSRLRLRCFNKHNPDEFKTGLMEALAYAEKHRIKHWLLDLREIGELEDEEEAWLQRYLFPCMIQKMKDGNYIAMVLSKLCYYRLLERAGKLGLESYNEMIVLKVFFELHKAQKWLNSKSETV
ncbi:hypothetical protein [Pontibacter mangrovi]|uniref:STAS/SEC14 domain-containing protein n=1 Tax=Pontibacter mangrovi TaxID=2589816 RepID=A0A501WB40_9BACT|nr:hypothetical protein [Pontibacter mangrovi]TPE46022.1 hypothetical protein FJM65_01365 [Pontibacter mangrovi]